MSKTKKLENSIKETFMLANTLGFWYSDICSLLSRKYHIDFTWYFMDNLQGKFYPIYNNGITLILDYNNNNKLDYVGIVYGTNDIRQ